jgi:uncharacterized protein (TIGR00255 family)
MPLMSMTGFGAATFSLGGQAWRVEVKSVNHKAFSLRAHLPAELAHAEVSASNLARQRLMRGSVEIHAQLESDAAEVEIHVNRPALAAFMRELQTVAAELGAPPPTLELALRQGNLVSIERRAVDPSLSERLFLEGLGRALDGLVAMRLREGEALSKDLEGRLASMEAMLAHADQEAPKITLALLERLRQRVARLEAELGTDLDKSRVLTELVVFSDKSDVTEEIVRARAHIAAFRATLAGDDDAERGRRLDFLTQELLREINTLGAKCRDAGVASAVVDAKVELEKIREQAQNIA